MPRLRLPHSPIAVWLLVIAGTLAVGSLDLATGAEVHVTSLYFVPLALAGWRLRRVASATAASLATGVWAVAQYHGGAAHWTARVWTINVVTQSLALLTVTMLFSVLADRLRIESAAARFDPLTGLRNRRALTEEAAAPLALCARHRRPVAVAFIDLDDFKQVNDRHGHGHGDRLLAACGRLIAAQCRSSDIAARWGGDEFVVVMPETGRDEAGALMERLRRALAAEPPMREHGVTATIGVLVDDPSTLDVPALLVHADGTMLGGKRSGKDRVVAQAAPAARRGA